MRGIAFGRELTLIDEGSSVFLPGVSEESFLSVWAGYLSLNEDYGEMNEALKGDPILEKAIAFGSGIRILKQDPWEATVSFLISQNNNIPRITKAIERLCSAYSQAGSFPTAGMIVSEGAEKLSGMGLGYRDSYIFGAALAYEEGRLDFGAISRMPTAEARKALMQLNGIGPKVADCILLFSLGKTDACPHDVWIKRAFSELYGVSGKAAGSFAEGRWGRYAGLAQQYLFYAMREGLFRAAENQ